MKTVDEVIAALQRHQKKGRGGYMVAVQAIIDGITCATPIKVMPLSHYEPADGEVVWLYEEPMELPDWMDVD